VRPLRFDRQTRLATRLVQLAAAAALGVGIGGIVTSGAGAQERDGSATTSTTTAINQNTYDLSAQANALDVLVTDPSLPLSGDLAYEAGPWGASATIDSLGESMSDAGAPYSPSIDSLPGTVNGIGDGNVPPLPPIPGYVSSDYPGTPTDNQTQGGYQITSSAAAETAKGAVGIGVQPSGSQNSTFFASAQTTANGDGSVSVDASAGMDALDFGQLFDLGNVSSTMSMTQQANQQPTVTSKTDLGTITLLGQASGLDAAGVSALGEGTPIDINSAVLGALNTLLSGAGITVTYLPETFTYNDGSKSTGAGPESGKTLQAIDSGALQVTENQNVPSQGPTTMSLTLGRIFVSTTDSPGIGLTTGNSGAIGNTGNTGDGATATSASSAGNTGNTGIVGGVSTVPASGTPSGSSSSSSAAAPTGPSAPQSVQTTPAFAVEEGPPAQSLYLVLVLCALTMLLGAQAVRYLAVRLALSGRTQ
jgi:hypothetical protein